MPRNRRCRAGEPRRVVVLYKSLPHYRVAFFDQLRDRLAREGVELVLIHGLPSEEDAQKADSSSLPWAQEIPNRVLRLPGLPNLYWQPCLTRLRSRDLVIVEQASKLLVNYALLATQRWGGPQIAFWGHGRNFQPHNSNKAGEFIKRRASIRAHWWFAYNRRSASAVENLGYPAERITVVNNAIDTAPFIYARANTSEDTTCRIRAQLGLHADNVGIYCGALYPEKRIPFLLEAAHSIRRTLPDFELLILGAGGEAPAVRAAIVDAPWIHYVGPKFGSDRIPYFLASKLALLPGLVGLAITDAFAFQVPLIAIDVPYHSPEIDYLANGYNGVLMPEATSADEYASTVASLMGDSEQLDRLRHGCAVGAATYTLEEMVDRFTGGVMGALAA